MSYLEQKLRRWAAPEKLDWEIRKLVDEKYNRVQPQMLIIQDSVRLAAQEVGYQDGLTKVVATARVKELVIITLQGAIEILTKPHAEQYEIQNHCSDQKQKFIAAIDANCITKEYGPVKAVQSSVTKKPQEIIAAEVEAAVVATLAAK